MKKKYLKQELDSANFNLRMALKDVKELRKAVRKIKKVLNDLQKETK